MSARLFLFLVHEVKSFTVNFSAAQQSHVDALMLTQSEKLEKLTKKHMKEIQSLDESHKAEITKLNEDHATHVVELENAKVQEQALIKSESQEEVSRLQTKIKQLEVKMSTLLDNLVSGSDPQTNLIKELKKEVESLRCVVDLKNEEIKSLRIEKDEMSQSLVSQNESQSKISNLTCQVEDLRELLELKVGGNLI